jgi:hypothetical protein
MLTYDTETQSLKYLSSLFFHSTLHCDFSFSTSSTFQTEVNILFATLSTIVIDALLVA